MAGHFPDPAPFIEQANRILDEARGRQVTIRLLGAIAFHLSCPNFNYIQRETGRVFTDIDFMSYFREKEEVERLFKDLGYSEDRRIKAVPGVRRSIFFHADQPWHSDVFYDVLDFSHEIDLRGRLEMEYPTLSLVDLLLEKMQIARINEKDIIDTLMLFREHEVGEGNGRIIQIDHLARSCKSDWGLWKTVTDNLGKVEKLADKYEILGAEDRQIIRERLERSRIALEIAKPNRRTRAMVSRRRRGEVRDTG